MLCSGNALECLFSFYRAALTDLNSIVSVNYFKNNLHRYGTPKTRLSPQAITLWYKPPELLLGAYEYSSAADMWSVGCIFAELLLRRPFLQGKNSDISQLDTIFTVNMFHV